MNYLIIDKIIKDALVEDGVFDDITTNSILNGNEKAPIVTGKQIGRAHV